MVSIDALLVVAAVCAAEPSATEFGVGASRGAPRLPPLGALSGSAAQTHAVDRGVVYVNFDGAVLTDDKEDSRTNSTLIGWSGTFEPYGDGMKRDAVMQSVRADWAPYDVSVTETRPTDGEYTMAMVGPTNFTEGALGIALLDCNDWWTHNNVVYAFHELDDNYTAAATATTINQEVAHTFGLEHVDAPSDIMNPYNAGGDPTFSDACLDLLPADGIGLICDAQHEAECGPGERQNAHAEIMRLFGPNAPDAENPTARIVAPMNDALYPTGSDFVIEADVTDDQGISDVVLMGGDQELVRTTRPPWAWQVTNAPAGEYRFAIVASDFAGNETVSLAITVRVEDDAPEPESEAGGAAPGDGSDPDDPGGSDTVEGSSGELDSDSADAGPDTEGGGDAGESDGDTFGEDLGPPRFSAIEAPEGCSCQTTTPPPGSTWLLLLGLGLIRPRSRATRGSKRSRELGPRLEADHDE